MTIIKPPEDLPTVQGDSTWAKLRRAWANYRRAKVAGDREKMLRWAKEVQRHQKGLGVSVASFEHLDLSADSNLTE